MACCCGGAGGHRTAGAYQACSGDRLYRVLFFPAGSHEEGRDECAKTRTQCKHSGHCNEGPGHDQTSLIKKRLPFREFPGCERIVETPPPGMCNPHAGDTFPSMPSGAESHLIPPVGASQEHRAVEAAFRQATIRFTSSL